MNLWKHQIQPLVPLQPALNVSIRDALTSENHRFKVQDHKYQPASAFRDDVGVD